MWLLITYVYHRFTLICGLSSLLAPCKANLLRLEVASSMSVRGLVLSFSYFSSFLILLLLFSAKNSMEIEPAGPHRRQCF